ncbi:MAG TPA: hypothetical protein ENN38_07795, partial [Actinobacteria bacterium]|nr:hypothetical protein [Actinomycetota bacterium]
MADKNRLNEKGFSLTELLIYSLLLLLVLSAVYGLLMSAVRSWQTGENVADIQQNARMAMDRMVSELRVCGGIVDDATHDSTTGTIYFTEHPGTTEVACYRYNESTKKILYHNTPLAEYVDFFNLTYYQDGTVLTAGFDGANRVKIEMEIEKDGIRKS